MPKRKKETFGGAEKIDAPPKSIADALMARPKKKDKPKISKVRKLPDTEPDA